MSGKQYYFNLLIAGLINLLLFTIIICFASPIYDTNEDVYILYQLSGGFGSPPTTLLHYNYAFPPFLTIALKHLFLITNRINWYTLILFFAHYLACTSIAFQLLQKSTKLVATLTWLTLFIVFESQLLLTINFTNTSIVLGLAGLTLLITYRSTNSLRTLVYAGLLLLAATCFRAHVLLPLTAIALPFLIFPWRRQQLMPVVYTLVITTVAIWGINQVQRAYYRSHLSSWEKEETHRQKIYSFYNNRNLHKPLPDEKWYTEYNLIQNGIPLDTSFLADQKLDQMLIDLKRKTPSDKQLIPSAKNWFFINNRIFFCVLLILLLLPGLDRKHLYLLAASLAITIGAFAFLVFNFKLPDYLLISAFYLFALLIVLSSQKQLSGKYLLGYTFLLLAMSLWGIIRIYKNNQRNITQIGTFKTAYKELAAFPGHLFIITDDSFPLQKFYVFDQPGQFPLPNMINSEHFMNNTYLPILNRFGSADVPSIPDNNRIFFKGKQLDALENYFKLTSGKQVTIIFDSTQSSSQKVYRIVQSEIGKKDTTRFP